MRAVIQRVRGASVTADGKASGRIGEGLAILIGIAAGDGEEQARLVATKALRLRVFPAAEGGAGFDRSVLEIGGGILLVSQFTLHASVRRGRRPDFAAAASRETAAPLFKRLASLFRESGLQVETGVFGAEMELQLTNSGPATFLLDSDDWRGTGGPRR